MPVKTFLNCTMPALVNIKVGSLRGTSGDDGTIVWSFRAKKSRKADLISLTPLICPSWESAPNPGDSPRAAGPFAFYLGARGLSRKAGRDDRARADRLEQPRPTAATRLEPTMMDQPSPPPRLASRLEERLRSKQFAITAEITPPLSCRPDDVTCKALPLRDLADAVNVTDGAGARAHMSATAAAFFLLQSGIEPVLQFTCRDRNRLALQSGLLGAAAVGIHNVLLLGGDDPSAGDQPDTKAVFDLDSRRLIETARVMRDRRELPNGKAIAGEPEFFIGAADMPIDPPPDWRPDGLKAKIA